MYHFSKNVPPINLQEFYQCIKLTSNQTQTAINISPHAIFQRSVDSHQSSNRHNFIFYQPTTIYAASRLQL